MTTDVRGAPMGTGRLAMILLHGRDQDPDWVVEHVVNPLVAELPDLPFTWLAPAALGRSWYAGRVHDPLPETLDERERAADVVDALAADLAAAGHAPETIVLGGFSQGACLVADHLLRRPRRWGAALIWTGTAFGPPDTAWPPPAGRLPLDGLPVLATNGDDDPWVPLPATEAMAGDLRAHGAAVELMVRPGRAHEVDAKEIASAAELLRRVAG